MSQKKIRRRRKSNPLAYNKRRRWTVIIISALVCLLLTGVIWARWRTQFAATSPTALAPLPQASSSPPSNPFAPRRAAKEYIYVNGRLQVVEEPKPPAGGTAFDINGNASGDVVVYRPSEGNWYVLDISTDPATSTLQQLGSGQENLVPGDYDGDGKTDIAIWKPNLGVCNSSTYNCGWYIKLSTDNLTVHYYADWGMTNDVAVPADYDGDGKMDRAVWRPSTSQWYIVNSSYGSNPNIPEQTVIGWGNATDLPVPADYDGDGKADAAVFRPTEGNWYIKNSGSVNTMQGWGAINDWLVPADYDGDGKADIAVWRPSEGNWYILQSSANGVTRLVNWGASTDIPVPADYDGDGRTDIAVWRPADGNWYIKKSSNGTALARSWGNPTDKPVPAAYVRH